MSTLAEIELAADALSSEDQEALLRRLSRKLAGRTQVAFRRQVPAPAVPMEELQRIHALIEAEFSQADAEGW